MWNEDQFVARVREAIDRRWPPSTRAANSNGYSHLEEASGVGEGTVSRMMREDKRTGKRRIPELRNIILIAHALDVSLDWLVTGAGSIDRTPTQAELLDRAAHRLAGALARVERETPVPSSEVVLAERK